MMSLYKFDDGWKIVTKVLRVPDAGRAGRPRTETLRAAGNDPNQNPLAAVSRGDPFHSLADSVSLEAVRNPT